MKINLLVLLTVALLAAGCGKKEVSFDTLETARMQARENAMYVAQRYRQETPKFQGWDIVGRGDSSQMPDCPQGDGWATMDFYSPDKVEMRKVKCSTVSLGIGCLEEPDFKTKSYASEDGHCQNTNKVPFPFRKIHE